ncbi:MAG: MGMT family protein [Acidobacteriota bacterium]
MGARSTFGNVRLHGDIQGDKAKATERVYALVRTIPKGRVMTYGQIAGILQGLSPRAVGWAMHACPRDVPWQRVVNASGGMSTERIPDIPPGLQRRLLEREGVIFGKSGKIDLDVHRHEPRAPRHRRRMSP